jgi:hypothetical protein
MLVHHTHARGQCGTRVSGWQALAKDFDMTFVRRVMAKQDIHQRSLARAVFAQQGNDFALPQIEGDRVIGGELAKSLGNVVEAQDI